MITSDGYFPIFLPGKKSLEPDTHGQGWHGETVSENIELCKYQTIEPLFRKYLPAHGRILEAGCGLGRWVFYLRRLGYDVVGIDLSDVAIKLAKSFDAAAPVAVDNVLHTSYADKSFDAVISLGVAEHFDEGPRGVFGEARRIMKDNGLFFVAVPYQNLLRKLFIYQLRRLRLLQWRLLRTSFAFEEYHFTRRRFVSLLEESGFEIIETSHDDFLHPKNMALYADSRFFRSNKKWELNLFGQFLDRGLRTISPWLDAAGIFCVCRKTNDRLV